MAIWRIAFSAESIIKPIFFYLELAVLVIFIAAATNIGQQK
jgi:hypothetical protein